MKRRTFLAASTLSLTTLAGCAGGTGDGGTTDATTRSTDATAEAGGSDAATGTASGSGEFSPANDGYPSTDRIDSVPSERSIDASSFDAVKRDGKRVPLAPLDVAHYWWARREARFADARGTAQYDAQHVVGAVSSPADGNYGDGDPASAWPKDDLIVCYCGCPHHLSSIRAAALLDAGYEDVYVIGPGYWKWKQAGYPIAGSRVESLPPEYEIRGRTAASDAGESAWVRHEASGQMEAQPIAADGSYDLHVRFADVGPSTRLTVETPSYAVRAPVSTLTEGVVTGEY